MSRSMAARVHTVIKAKETNKQTIQYNTIQKTGYQILRNAEIQVGLNIAKIH